MKRATIADFETLSKHIDEAINPKTYENKPLAPLSAEEKAEVALQGLMDGEPVVQLLFQGPKKILRDPRSANRERRVVSRFLYDHEFLIPKFMDPEIAEGRNSVHYRFNHLGAGMLKGIGVLFMNRRITDREQEIAHPITGEGVYGVVHQFLGFRTDASPRALANKEFGVYDTTIQQVHAMIDIAERAKLITQ